MLGLAEQRQTRQSEQEVPRPVTLIDKKKTITWFMWMMKKLIAEEVKLTWKDILMLYRKALTTIAAIAVLTTMTRITDARRISTWFHRKCTFMSIPILDRKRAANKLRIGSTYNHQVSQWDSRTVNDLEYTHSACLRKIYYQYLPALVYVEQTQLWTA